MMSNNKILTVSYGTFSCTLEGFEDSFGTMKAIAEYFRDLASNDRYFGAEPPQPDAEMLARIAEREIARRVEAREDEGRIVLSAAAPAAAAEQTEEPAEPEASTVQAEAEEEAVAETAEDEVVIDASEEEAEEEAVAAEDVADAEPEAVAEDTVAEEDSANEPVAQEEEFIAEDETNAVEEISAETDEVEPVDAEASDETFEEEHAPVDAVAEYDEDEDDNAWPTMSPTARAPAPAAGSIAEKLQRIRAVVNKTKEIPQAQSEFEEDEHVEDMMAQAAASDETYKDESYEEEDATIASVMDHMDDGPAADAQEEAPVEEVMEDADDAISNVLDAVAEDNVTEDAVAEVDEDAQAASEELDAPDDATLLDAVAEATSEVDEVAVEDISAEDVVSEDEAEEIIAEDVTDADIADASEEQSANDDLIDAFADELSETDAPETDFTSASFADDAFDTTGFEVSSDAHAEEAAEEAVAEDTQTEEVAEAEEPAEAPKRRARVIKVKRSDVEEAIKTGALEEIEDDDDEDVPAILDGSLSDDDEAELQAELAAVEAEMAEAEDEIEDTGEIAAEITDEAAEEAPAFETDVNRLMDKADEQMEEPESTQRRNAFQALKAAVWARKTDSDLGEEDEETKAGAYKSDLAQVVQPRRPAASAESRSDRPQTEERPAPLRLVAEQRIDTGEPETPVIPRRVAAEDEAIEKAAEAESFAEYASEMGAHDLSDILEAAASYLTFIEGREQFSRPQLMTKVRQVEKEDFSREDGLRSFGQLLRSGKIAKIRGGRFSVTEDIGYKPDQREAG